MLSAYMNFLAILKQIEALEAYKKRIIKGDVPLNQVDKEIIINLTYSLRNSSYMKLDELDSEKVKLYIKNNLKKFMDDDKVEDLIPSKDNAATTNTSTYINSYTEIDTTPSINTSLQVNTYSEINTKPVVRRSKRKTKTPSRLGFN